MDSVAARGGHGSLGARSPRGRAGRSSRSPELRSTAGTYPQLSRYQGLAIHSPACESATGRISTRAQHPEAQHDALRAAGRDDVFIDRASGKLASRPELDKALLSANRAGDQLVITKLDRLGRSLEHLIGTVRPAASPGRGPGRAGSGDRHLDRCRADVLPDVACHPSPWQTTQILGSIAEFSVISTRVDARANPSLSGGLAAARARGRTGGQKPKLGPRQVRLARQMYEELDDAGKRRYTVAQIAAEFGGTRPTIYRHLARQTV